MERFFINERKIKMAISLSQNKNSSVLCKYPASPLLFTLSDENTANDCEISLDEITVSGDINIDKCKDRLRENNWILTSVSRIDGQPSTYNLFRDADSIATLSKNKYYSDSWRIDTSNHLTAQEKRQITNITKIFNKPRITRIDIAVDFINFDDAGMIYTLYRPHTKTFFTIGANGKLESITAGVRKSRQVYRYYDKFVELQQKRVTVPDYIKNWERAELQLRQTKTYNTVQDWGDRVVKMLNCLSLPEVTRLAVPDVRERAMINQLLHHPDEFQNVSSKTRAKYRKKIRELHKKSTPTRIKLAMEVLQNRKNDIQKEINSFL